MLLPPEECLVALQPSVLHLTRSALHRGLQRHGIARLPDGEGDQPKRQRSKRYPVHCALRALQGSVPGGGSFHIAIAGVQTVEGKPSLRRQDRSSSLPSSDAWARKIAGPPGSSPRICSSPSLAAFPVLTDNVLGSGSKRGCGRQATWPPTGYPKNR